MGENTSRLYSILGLILEDEPTPFSGFFVKESPNPQGLIGDQYGLAYISDLSLDENNIRFCKEYVDRESRILYSLQKEGDLWTGRYNGDLELCGGVIAKIDSVVFPSDLIIKVLQEERNPDRIGKSVINHLVNEGILIPRGEKEYDINSILEEPDEKWGKDNLPF